MFYRRNRAHRPAVWPSCLLALAGLLAGNATEHFASPARANTFVQMDYNISLSSRARGTAFIELFDDRPITRDNFLAYVNGGRYNNTLMHRLAFLDPPNNTMPFVLQGGGYYLQYLQEPPPLDNSLNPALKVDLDGNSGTSNPMILNEYGNSPPRSNLKGTLAMAKLAPPPQGPPNGGPNSATCEYFFNLADNSANLNNQNGGFTVFAQVVGDGMTLIDAYNGLDVLNRNPDFDDNGTRDPNLPFDNLPALVSGGSYLPLMLEQAKVVDYLGNGLVTTVPAGGLTFATRDAFFDTGTVFNGASTGLTVGPNRTLGIREGYVLNRPLANNGTIAPGLSLGAITVQGNFFQFSAGTLEIELGGLTPDTQYDKLVATGNAFLNGKLRVQFQNSFAPAAGNSFTILSAASITGNFSLFELPQLNEGLVWNVAKSQTAISLSIASADYNRNGIVDAADYAIWRKTRNTNVTPFAGADGNGDGIINDLDYTVWRSNIGNRRGTVGGAGSLLDGGAVPEPSSALALMATAALFAARRRRR